MTTYTQINRAAVMAPLDPAVRGSWASICNATIALYEQNACGVVSIDLTGVAAHTLSTANNAPDEARMAMQIYTGASSGAATIVIPPVARIGWAANQSTHTVTLTTGSGTTLLVPLATSYLYRCDGTNITAVNIVPSGQAAFGANPVTGSNFTITGGAISGTPISGSTGAFTTGTFSSTLSVSGATTLAAVTVNGTETHGANAVTGTNFSIGGGAITGTPISGSTGAFTTGQFSGTLQANGILLANAGLTVSGVTAVNGPETHGANPVTGSNFTITGGAITNTPISGSSVSGTSGTFSGAVSASALATTGNLNVLGAAAVTAGLTVGANLLVGTGVAGGGYYCRNGSTGVFGADVFNLYWNGTGMVLFVDTTNLGYISTSSDARYKHQVSPLGDGALSDILRLAPVSFRWRDKALFRDDGQRHAGLLAQDVAKVIPSAVSDGDVLSLQPLPLIATLVKAVQELTARVASLEAR